MPPTPVSGVFLFSVKSQRLTEGLKVYHVWSVVKHDTSSFIYNRLYFFLKCGGALVKLANALLRSSTGAHHHAVSVTNTKQEG